jgi:hypothetical protein
MYLESMQEELSPFIFSHWHNLSSLAPNAAGEPPLEAGAERTL